MIPQYYSSPQMIKLNLTVAFNILPTTVLGVWACDLSWPNQLIISHEFNWVLSGLAVLSLYHDYVTKWDDIPIFWNSVGWHFYFWDFKASNQIQNTLLLLSPNFKWMRKHVVPIRDSNHKEKLPPVNSTGTAEQRKRYNLSSYWHRWPSKSATSKVNPSSGN